jgi:ribonuclease P protein component
VKTGVAKPVPRNRVEARFVAVMGQPPCARTEHFMVHHLRKVELSTGLNNDLPKLVDGTPVPIWLGLVVPKRHARRSVTRNLMRRQIRACVERHQARLALGDWVVRLRKGFAAESFPSAASVVLAAQVREELEQLMARASRTQPSAPVRVASS